MSYLISSSYETHPVYILYNVTSLLIINWAPGDLCYLIRTSSLAFNAQTSEHLGSWLESDERADWAKRLDFFTQPGSVIASTASPQPVRDSSTDEVY